jgi:hypothetical protein
VDAADATAIAEICRLLGAVTSGVVAGSFGISPSEILDYRQFVTTLQSKLGPDDTERPPLAAHR